MHAAKYKYRVIDDNDWWGGLNVILAGDFHQLPPVAMGHSEYLFVPTFHFIIKAILETLLGIKVTPFHITSELGVLGERAAHFGVVECQERGGLHFHGMLWLKNTPSSDEL